MKSKKNQRRILRIVLILVDTLAIAAGYWLAYLVRFETALFPGYFGFGDEVEGSLYLYLQLFALILPICLLIFFFLGLYESNYLVWGSAGRPLQIVHATSLGVIVIIIGSFLFKENSISRVWLTLTWIFSILSLNLGRLLFTYSVNWLARRGIVANRALIIGTNKDVEVLVQQLQKASLFGASVIGYAVNNRSKGLVKIPDLSEVITPSELPDIVAKYQIDSLLVSNGSLSQERLEDVIRRVGRGPVDIYVSHSVGEIIASSRMALRVIAGIPFVGIRGAPLSGKALVFKRVFDFFGSIFFLLVLAPLFLVVALLIKLDSPGPVFYVQGRSGKNGKVFGMYKFRTMIQGADKMQGQLRKASDVDGPIFKIKHDPRITRVGKWLRKLSLDELPQLINVFKGEMALVGPRPLSAKEADCSGDWWQRRLEVTPGMTGLWQIRGRSDLSFEDMVKLDFFYVENWALGVDFSILLHTIPAVLKGRGAY